MGMRDMQCGGDVAKMAELNRWENEYIAHGCGYVDEGQIKYMVSGKFNDIAKFVENSAGQGIYPTPIMSRLERRLKPAGTEYDIRQEVKIKLAQDIQETYGKQYFEAIEAVCHQPANNSGYSLLFDQQEQLDGIFDEEKLHMFEGLVQLAYEAKVLDDSSYNDIHKWLRKNRAQMQDDVIVKASYERTFCGFVYEKANGQLGYFCDADREVTDNKRARLQLEELLVGPIFRKTYWFDTFSMMKDVRRDYEEKMYHMLKGSYIDIVRAIKRLPSAIDETLFTKQLAKVEQCCTAEAIKAFKGYGYRWNLLKWKV